MQKIKCLAPMSYILAQFVNDLMINQKIIIFSIDYFYRRTDLAEHICTFYHNYLMEELQEFFDSFTCKICFEPYKPNKTPQILSCSTCVNLIRRRRQNVRRYFRCPYCQLQRPFDDIHEYRQLLQIKTIVEKLKIKKLCTDVSRVQQIHFHLERASELMKVIQNKDYSIKQIVNQERSPAQSSFRMKSEPELKGFLMLYERSNEKCQKKQKAEEKFKRLIQELLKNAEFIDAMIYENQKTKALLDQREAELNQKNKQFKIEMENIQDQIRFFLDEKKSLIINLQLTKDEMEHELKKKNQTIFNLQQKIGLLKNLYQQNELRNINFPEQKQVKQQRAGRKIEQIDNRQQTRSNKSMSKLHKIRSLDFLMKR